MINLIQFLEFYKEFALNEGMVAGEVSKKKSFDLIILSALHAFVEF